MELATTVRPLSPFRPLALGTSVYAIGSCFAELMAERLRQYLFPVILNPHGIVYNPVSAAAMLDPQWREPELFLHEGQWRSLDHHSGLAWGARDQALQLLANAERLKVHALEQSQCLLLTLGTAQAFTLAGQNRVVANCHRLPQSLFGRRRLNGRECWEALAPPLLAWLEQDPKRQAVVTVSPVRYLRDGLVDNSRGKAALLLLCEELEAAHPRLSYFPAYEILIDELRSYRYFERDMVHPNALAVDLVWERFARTYLEPETLPRLADMDRLLAALRHRPAAGTDQRALGEKSLRRLAQLETTCPELDTTAWREAFQAMVEP